MTEHTDESDYGVDETLTDAEKRLRDWLLTHPEGSEMWMIVKGGFRRSYRLGRYHAIGEIAMAVRTRAEDAWKRYMNGPGGHTETLRQGKYEGLVDALGIATSTPVEGGGDRE